MHLRGQCNGAQACHRSVGMTARSSVGERDEGVEVERGTSGGAFASENAGMSSVIMCENRMRRKPEVSDGRSVRVGSVGP